jgi:hypothetical protein
MIFTPTLTEIVNCNTNSYYNNKSYKLNTIYKFYQSFLTGIQGKRCLYNSKGNLETARRVLIRDTNNVVDTIKSLHMEQLTASLKVKAVFLFTDDYGDRNICHWMTEQLLVLNYLIDILQLLNNNNKHTYNDGNDGNDDDNDDNENTKKSNLDANTLPFSISDLKIVINKNPRQSMYQIIRDYLYKIPYLDKNNILEIDLEDNKIYQNGELLSDNGMEIQHCFVGNTIRTTLNTIYDGWNKLHNRLNLDSSDNKDIYSSENHYNCPHFYMSRRNLLDPNKKTNTRVLENLDEVSNIINNKGYTEIFTDELNTLEERIYLFKNAKSIVCELGAGMHNLLYCSEGTEIYIMLQKNNYSWLQEYFPLFKQKNMKVCLLIGETTNSEHNGNWLNTPWKLDILELNKISIPV